MEHTIVVLTLPEDQTAESLAENFAQHLNRVIGSTGYECKTYPQLQRELTPGSYRNQLPIDIVRSSAQVLLFVLPGVNQVKRSEVFAMVRDLKRIVRHDLAACIPVLFPGAPNREDIFLIQELWPVDLRDPKHAREQFARLLKAILEQINVHYQDEDINPILALVPSN